MAHALPILLAMNRMDIVAEALVNGADE